MTKPRALALATVAQSLRFQSPATWRVLSDKGMDITFAAHPDEWAASLEEFGEFVATRTERRLRPRSLLSGLLDVRDLLQREWALIQVQGPVTGMLARVIPTSKPLIYVAHGFHFHGDGPRMTNLAYRTVERVLAGRCNGLGVVSAEDFAAAKRLNFHRRTYLWRLPGAGVDLTRFPLAASPGSVPLRLLFMGELNDNKDPTRFVRIHQRLRALGYEADGTVIGDGPLRDVVRSAVEADRTGSLRWLPHTDTPEMEFQKHHVLLMPSRREGLPRVIVEALATGRPVVAQNNRGSRELLTTSAHGRTLAPGAPIDEWVQAVLEVSRLPETGHLLRESVAAYGRERFATSYGQFVDRVLCDPSGVGAFDLADQDSR